LGKSETRVLVGIRLARGGRGKEREGAKKRSQSPSESKRSPRRSNKTQWKRQIVFRGTGGKKMEGDEGGMGGGNRRKGVGKNKKQTNKGRRIE